MPTPANRVHRAGQSDDHIVDLRRGQFAGSARTRLDACDIVCRGAGIHRGLADEFKKDNWEVSVILRKCLMASMISLGLIGDCRAGSNPLIGHWRVEPGGDVNSDGFAYCKVTPELVFTPTTETMYADGGAHGTNDVIYLVSGQDIYVSSSEGFVGAPKFTMLGPDEMTLDAVGHCKYRRQ